MQTIEYSDFAKLQLVIATVVTVEIVEGADRLLKLELDAGSELGQRVVVSGIREWYQPEDLLQKQVVYLTNLAPLTIRGIESQGMILAVTDDPVRLLQPDFQVAAGAQVQ